jgi:hypothetical protein
VTGFSSLSTGRHFVYTLNIPGIYLVYSWYDSLFLVPAATPSSSSWFGCLCQWEAFRDWNDRGHFQAIYSSRSSLCVHIHKSKNPKCVQEWSKIKLMTSPGNLIAGGASGMGPCPLPKHQQPGEVNIHIIICIYHIYMVYIYGIYIYSIYNVYTIYIHNIYFVFTMYIPCSIYHEHITGKSQEDRYIHGIYILWYI